MKNCVICGRFLSKQRKKCCSARCVGKVRGRAVFGTGSVAPYIKIKFNGKDKYYHRCVWERANGRKLKDGEIVHHINGDKRDNRPQNLQVVASHAEHLRLHNYFKREKQMARENRRNQFQRNFSELGW